jgi:hypothetical protein
MNNANEVLAFQNALANYSHIQGLRLPLFLGLNFLEKRD